MLLLEMLLYTVKDKLGLGESHLAAVEGAEAQRLEDLIGQLACVW